MFESLKKISRVLMVFQDLIVNTNQLQTSLLLLRLRACVLVLHPPFQFLLARRSLKVQHTLKKGLSFDFLSDSSIVCLKQIKFLNNRTQLRILFAHRWSFLSCEVPMVEFQPIKTRIWAFIGSETRVPPALSLVGLVEFLSLFFKALILILLTKDTRHPCVSCCFSWRSFSEWT